MTTSPRKVSWLMVLPVVASVLLLSVMASSRLNRPSAEDAEPHHAGVREAVRAMPSEIDSWFAEDQAIPAAAVELLKPNALRSRSWADSKSGDRASMLVVHCRDARDLNGHYPPVCYPAHGYSDAHEQRPIDFVFDDLTIHATEYHFTRGEGAEARQLIVLNFMVLPNGEIHRNDHGLRQLAADYANRFYGAGQIQIIPPRNYDDQQREEAYRMFLQPHLPLIQSMRRVVGQTTEVSDSSQAVQ